MSIGYSIDETPCYGGKGANNAVVPYGHNAGSVVGEANRGTVEIVHHDAQQLLLAIGGPDANALVASGGKNSCIVSAIVGNEETNMTGGTVAGPTWEML